MDIEPTIDDKLATTRFRQHHEPHILVDGTKCEGCSTRDCLIVCPAKLFSLLTDGTILFNYEQCFECGACYVACNRDGAITWSYPQGGYGVCYRET